MVLSKQNEIRLHSSICTGKKTWTKEAMKNALEAVSNKEMTVRQAYTELSTPTAVLDRREGICYMPFFSSTEEKQLASPLAEHKKLQNSFTLEEEDFDHFTKGHYNVIVTDVPNFSDEEEVRFAIRYENGYDLKHDDRYNQ